MHVASTTHPLPVLGDPAPRKRVLGGARRRLATCSDEWLLQMCARGDWAAFETIVSRHRGAMLRCARSAVGRASADDVVQMASINAWRALRRGGEVQSLRPWLLTIVRRCASQTVDRRELRPLDEELLADGAGTHDELELRSEARRALEAVAALPHDERVALVGTTLQGRSGRDSARALGVTEGQVRQLVFRARSRLREQAQGVAAAFLPLPMLGRRLLAAVQHSLDGPLAGKVAVVAAAGALAAAPAVEHRAGGSSSKHAPRVTVSRVGVESTGAAGPSAAGPLARSGRRESPPATSVNGTAVADARPGLGATGEAGAQSGAPASAIADGERASIEAAGPAISPQAVLSDPVSEANKGPAAAGAGAPETALDDAGGALGGVVHGSGQALTGVGSAVAEETSQIAAAASGAGVPAQAVSSLGDTVRGALSGAAGTLDSAAGGPTD